MFRHALGSSGISATDVQVGYREPYIWADVLQGASQILEHGGILLMYDTET